MSAPRYLIQAYDAAGNYLSLTGDLNNTGSRYTDSAAEVQDTILAPFPVAHLFDPGTETYQPAEVDRWVVSHHTPAGYVTRETHRARPPYSPDDYASAS